MKDMPTLQPEGLGITCALPREDPRDAFVSRAAASLAALPAGGVVGTSSLRRRAQVRFRRPDLEVVEFRGSVETRLRKLGEGIADATFLGWRGFTGSGSRTWCGGRSTPGTCSPRSPRARSASSSGSTTAGRDASRRDPSRADRHTPRRRARLPRRARRLVPDPDRPLAELRRGTLRLRGEIIRPDGSERIAHALRKTPPTPSDRLRARRHPPRSAPGRRLLR